MGKDKFDEDELEKHYCKNIFCRDRLNKIGVCLYLNEFGSCATKKKYDEYRRKTTDNYKNPFCDKCKETDCEISTDDTCAMIREYLKAKDLEEIINNIGIELDRVYDAGNDCIGGNNEERNID